MSNVFKSIPYSFYENYCGYVESKNSKPVAEDVIFSVLDSEGCRVGSDEILNTGDMYIVLESGRYFLGTLVGCREDDGACMLFELFNDDDMDVYISADRHIIRKVPVEHVKPDLEMITGAVIEIKLGSGDFEKVGGFKNLIEDTRIEAKAEELYNIYVNRYTETISENCFSDWLNATESCREGFRAIARHLATPQTDVQHALQAALESERELMDILRKIGKVFGKNVGTDIGILDLPKLVEENRVTVSQQQQSGAWSTLCELFPEYLNNNSGTGEECMITYINTLRGLRNDLIEVLEIKPRFNESIRNDELINIVRAFIGDEKPEPSIHDQLSFHKQNSKQIVRLNNWLQEHNLTKPGVCVTDTIIELLEKAPTPQLINASRVMNAIHIKPELRAGMTEDRIIENLEILHRDAAEGDSFRKFAINNLDFGAHIKPNQIRTGLAERHENYKSMQRKLKDISEVMKTK